MKPVEAHWDELVRVAASIQDGWCTAVQAQERFGSDARGDPLYQAASALGQLMRTVYLCDYFSNAQFRDSLRSALNHGESIHQLQRSIRSGVIAPKRVRSHDEQIAISGALSLLTNIVMAWNTTKLQVAVDQRARQGKRFETQELARIGPVATSHINFRGVLHFPVAEFEAQLFLKAPPIALAA